MAVEQRRLALRARCLKLYALGVCGLLLSLVGNARADDRWYFDIDPARSVLTATITVEFPELGLTATSVGQGTRGEGIPGFSNGNRGQIDGILSAMVDLSAGTMQFGGGSLFGLDSGIWEPLPGGEHGIAPAFLGILIRDVEGIPARAVASIRNFWFDYADAYQVTNLTSTAPNRYSFQTDEWLAVSTAVDLEGQSGLAATFDATRVALNERFAARNSGKTGSLSQLPAGNWQLNIPVDSTVSFDAGDVEGIGPVFVELRATGNLVGTSVVLSSASPILEANGAHDTPQTALNLDGRFNTQFDARIGNNLVNSSKAAPHVAVHGALDGQFEYFKFTVLDASTVASFDVDEAAFDSTLYLFDALGNLLASNDDAPSPSGAGGSRSSNDAFFEYTFAKPGVYTLALGRFQQPGFAAADRELRLDGEYVLNVSLTSAIVPEPSTFALAGMGFLALLGMARGKRRGRAAIVACLLIAICFASNRVEAASLAIKQSQEFTFDEGGIFPQSYRLFSPPSLASSDEKFPLVLFLHGSGERGTDNYKQVASHIDGLIAATQSERFASFLLTPQQTDFPFAGGWDPTGPYDRTSEILDELIANYPIDLSRIYITGLSMGGYGTFDYIADNPGRFAAAVPMSGGGSTSSAPFIKDVPLWVFHGALDATVSVNQSRNMVNAIRNAGGSPLYTELPTGGHDIWGPIYNDAATGQYGLYEWMFSQSLGGDAARVAAVPEPTSLVLALSAAVVLAVRVRWRRRS